MTSFVGGFAVHDYNYIVNNYRFWKILLFMNSLPFLILMATPVPLCIMLLSLEMLNCLRYLMLKQAEYHGTTK